MKKTMSFKRDRARRRGVIFTAVCFSDSSHNAIKLGLRGSRLGSEAPRRSKPIVGVSVVTYQSRQDRLGQR